MTNNCDINVGKYNYYLVVQSKKLSDMYMSINENASQIRHAYTKWERTVKLNLDFDEFCQLFKNIYRITNNAKLRSFQ